MERTTHRWARSLCRSTHRTGLVAVLSVGLASCGATEPWELVDVRLSVVDSVFTPQTPVVFEITAVNQGPEEVMLLPSLCPPTFDVLDTSGRVVGPGMPLCTLVAPEPKTLAPGEAVSYAYEWAGELYTIGAGSNLLAFGDYVLRGWVVVLPDHRIHSESVAVRFVDADG